MINRPAITLVLIFMAQLLLAACGAESVHEEERRSVNVSSETTMAASPYSEYETLVNQTTNSSVSVGMNKADLERILGAPSKTEQSGNEGEYWNTYSSGIAVNYKNDIAMIVSVERAATGYITNKGNIAIGDPVEQVRKQFGQESIFMQGFNDLMYTLVVRGDEVTTMKLPVESSAVLSALQDADIYVLEFRIDDQQHVSKISLVAKEVYMISEELAVPKK